MSLVPLSETLIRYQEREELLVMSSANDSNREMLRELYERTKITSEDLSRKYSKEDIKELCLRTNIRVNMTHMNCVYDAKKRLTKQGRFINRSDRFINAMLAKAVNRGMVRACSDEEVEDYRHIQRCQLQKDNNVRLDRWKKQRVCEIHDESLEADELESEVHEESEATFLRPLENEENLQESAALSTVVENQQGNIVLVPALNEDDIIEEIDEDLEETGFMPTVLGKENPNTLPNINVLANSNAPHSLDECLGIGDESEPERNQDNTQGDSNASKGTEGDTQTPHEPNIDWINDYNNINSESMSLPSNALDSSQSQPIETQSQEYGVVADYISFNTQVVTTSTQDQETEMFL